ncbi:solute carrier family 28 member 3-like [Lytechinus pictus]|uniref:solute carrier family 28 member 3-like n=1 Tax=Lytechinus pictus TaxID=7653 RepID=UPI0030BA0351
MSRAAARYNDTGSNRKLKDNSPNMEEIELRYNEREIMHAGDSDITEAGDNTEDQEDEDLQAIIWKKIFQKTGILSAFFKRNRKTLKDVFIVLLICLYSAYLIAACINDFEAALILVIITSITVVVYSYVLIRDTKGEVIDDRCIKPMWRVIEQKWTYLKWPLMVASLVGFGVVLYLVTRNNPIQLISFAGLVLLILLCYFTSTNPNKVLWRPVIWGLVLQFLLGFFVLRTYVGLVIFERLNTVIVRLFSYSSAGAIFLFGEGYQEHFFAFAVLPIVFYFSALIGVLYYWGIMQVLIQKMAWLMQRTMKTTAIESINAAGNIFFGMSESSVMIAPYLEVMTKSELHAVMTGGLATVAGATLGGYIFAGIDPSHLIAASVMSAPAALAISKLAFPETEKSKLVTESDVELPKGTERNVVEAAANGAALGISLVLNIAANLVAFLSLLALLNALLGYIGGLVGYPELTFELICSYVFMPLAFMMGVEWSDCQVVAELIGLKTFLNEFYAYGVMGEYIRNRATGNGPTLSVRSEVIATYALCGFSNIGSVGMILGILTPLAPNQTKILSPVALRALFAGSVACFTTACIAGILYVPEDVLVTNSTSIPGMTTVY